MSGANPRVLHVEDNDFFARVTASVLGDEYDIDVVRAADGDAALGALERERFDCIVSDYRMPGMDGLELFDAVRDAGRELPFILLTGGGNERIASEAITAGVTDYLTKSDDEKQFAMLANRIDNAITRHRTERLAERQIVVNDLLWDVSQSVRRSSSREAIHRTVCDRLADSQPYALAWIGEVRESTATVRPKATAGVDRRYLDAVALDDDRTGRDRAAVRDAVRTRSVRVELDPDLGEAFDADSDGSADRYAVAAVPLAYEGGDYGVLSVWSDARYAFGETERRVLSKFGTGITSAIDSVRTRKELVRREQRLQVFNRILRHNLRNDLNVVLGRADNISERFPAARDEAEVIKQKAAELIDISEKAREVGQTLDSRGRTGTKVDAVECVERTCAEFRQSYPDADIDAELPDSARVYADKTLEAAINEVVENAIEHNDGDPTVTIRVATVDDEWVNVTVLDDGPGIPAAEREVLAEGEETELHHGSGLGLWLANWIVGKFGGEVLFDEYHTNGGAVTLRLRRAEDALEPPEPRASDGK
ncbi:response regulator [Halorussus halobius]|uniref:response regulator n=1 Tax=Halorussus halobius TaxID=1710537 RepID=UPI001091B7B3|nr:response regulator [Halorussus halobius]